LPQERLSMRKFKEVLRLHSLGLKQRQIARSCSIAQSTVHQYLKAAAEAGVSWPLPPEWNEQQWEEALFRRPRPSWQARQAAQPDFPAIRRQLQTHRNLTLQLLWEEYREGNPEGYSYSRYVAAVFMLRDYLKAMTDAVNLHVYAT
jgi:transposase